MSEALVPAAAATSAVTDMGPAGFTLPQVIVDAGPEAAERFLEFFAGRIANERGRAPRTRGPLGSFWRGARREVSASRRSPRSTWPPTSERTRARSRPSSSTWLRSACSATGSSSARSAPRETPGRGVRTEARGHQGLDAGPLPG